VDGTLSGLTDEGDSTVSGTGTIASDLSLARGSLLSAAAGTTLHVSGNLNFTPGSTYGVALTAAGTTGAVAVTGNLAIASGTTLTVNAAAGQYSAGSIYKILSYTGSESGAFSSVNTNLAYMGPQVVYDPGVVAIELSPNAGFSENGFRLPGAALNDNDVATVLNGVYAAGGNGVTKGLIADTTAQAQSDMANMAGDEAAVSREIAANQASQVEDVVAQHLSDVSGSSLGGLWASASGEHDNVASNTHLGASGWQDDAATAGIGYDKMVSPTVRVGGALLLSNDMLTFSQQNASDHVDGAQALLYGAYQPAESALYVKGVAGVGYQNDELTRTVAAAGLSGEARGTFDTTGESLYVEAGLDPMLLGTRVTVQPYVGLRAGRYSQSAYAEQTENGTGAFDLSYAGAGNDVLASVLGARLASLDVSLLGRPLQLRADVAWEHQLSGVNRSVEATFESNPGQSWEAYSTPADRDTGSLTVGAAWKASERVTLSGSLTGELGTHSRDYSAQLGAQWQW
jgi:outer membrane autotransporter protein